MTFTMNITLSKIVFLKQFTTKRSKAFLSFFVVKDSFFKAIHNYLVRLHPLPPVVKDSFFKAIHNSSQLQSLRLKVVKDSFFKAIHNPYESTGSEAKLSKIVFLKQFTTYICIAKKK